MVKSLETLSLRVHAHCDNAEKLATMLGEHPKVERIYYPGRSDHPQFDIAQKQMERGSNLIAIDLKGGKDQAFNFLNELQIAKISNNLGDAKTLVTHPATTTHQKLPADVQAELGILPGSVRISVGLEDPSDLVDDFAHALNTLGK